MSAAGDAGTYYARYDTAYGAVDGTATVTARKALGPAATPPSAEDSGSGDSAAQV
ncbi:hypothetical protein ACFU3E_28685 [Streptomyces sp. NPDC057424]|uniref:hypothetical protein n=1 Tax=Streptomyces sp. NPDC057424 TaxID=3346127 RepID=UPI0036AE07D7